MSGHFHASRVRSALLLLGSVSAALAASVIAATEAITTRTDDLGRLLNDLASRQPLAGLSRLTYENRDGQHSPFPVAEWPGLKSHAFTPEDEATGRSKGPAQVIRDHPVIGNCSMAAPAQQGGSLPRFYFLEKGGPEFLFRQYISNQVFVYPEHQDHDPGAWGQPGWGDLFPLNSPSLIITQGSSGSDQPFLTALFAATAALPPETQRTLIERKLLSPTLQFLLRRHGLGMESDSDYLSGRAHPVVFDATTLDAKPMVLAASTLTQGAIPPVAVVEVLSESQAENGRDFFEPESVRPWQLATTPVCVARIFRGTQPEYECLLNTGRSGDLLNRPVSVKTVLLQGDPDLVRIEEIPEKRQVRLRIRWHPPEAIRNGDKPIRSHRVDIGFFADNGVSLSAPALFSIYMPPNERRHFDKSGRLAEVIHRTANPDLGLPTEDDDPRWIEVIKAAILRGDGLRSTLMERALEPAERAQLNVFHSRLSVLQGQLQASETALATASSQKANDAAPSVKALQEKTARLRREFIQTLRDTVATVLPGPRALSTRRTLETALLSIARFTDLYPRFQKDLDALAAASPKPNALSIIQTEVDQLVAWGFLLRQSDGSLRPLHESEQRPDAENESLRLLNLTLLSHALYPNALQRHAGPAWVDPRIAVPKPWRDVYRYDEKTGERIGWVRHHAGRIHSFDSSGRLVLPDTSEPKTVIYQNDTLEGLRFSPAP